MTGAERALQALEQLSSQERAVFLLRDVFGCGIPRIAAAVGCTQEACRRLAVTVPVGDGRGLPAGWPRRIVGAENVARLLAVTVPPLVGFGVTVEEHPVDGRPGVVFRDRDGDTLAALALDIADGRIHTLRVVLGSEQA
ncbi:sigma factor-like helix-turn-helix DNA-binding protein [Streptomyces mutabilis]|uniref:RNA polymerase sigma factor 70 region 4 type 2 domain-containing protein n=1 Tax=Streptomyces mutabilis TaxID=67332 RepID=A0A086MRP2_9ACTN|nr:sigma factor-like helix-turn-helix DNA-binding protein [Streptomyces mutabilis]KFG71560.1 hypothetical protein FM21_32695 [Streptomyces mutabilis]